MTTEATGDTFEGAEGALGKKRAEGRASLPLRHRQVAALLTQLATTARAFLFYDVGNDAIRQSLQALLEAFGATLAAETHVRLDVRPFEIAFEGQQVYLDRDRDRSLAFRLYRDGVRALVFHEGFAATELAHLLEILSVRFTGVHQHEDDTVTLLWKAGLRFVDVIAVEGMTPDSGRSHEDGRAQPSEPRSYLPEDVDLPLVPSCVESTPAWVEVEPAVLDALRAEVAAAALPEDGLRLLAVLARSLDDPDEAMPFSEVIHLCEETRDFLLSAENLTSLMAYVRQLQRMARTAAAWDPDRHAAVVGVLLSCGSDRAVRRLIRSVPASERVLRPEMVEFLDIVCPDPCTAVAEALAVEERPSGRAAARQLLEHYGKRRGSFLRQRFDGAQGRVAADLLRSLAGLEGETTATFLARQCAHPDSEVREEALWHLERSAYTGALGHAFVEAVRRTEGVHRRRVLALIERSRDRRFVEPLVALVESGLHDTEEAVEVARVIGKLEGAAGLERWQPMLTPKGRFLRRRLLGTALQQAAAATAVAQVPGDEAVHLLRLGLSAARPEARPWIERLLRGSGALAPSPVS